MQKVIQKWQGIVESVSAVHREAGRYSLAELLGLLWEDLVANRTWKQWLYLIVLASIPFILEFTSPATEHDWLGLFASWTGIVCVVLVAEERASNYLFEAINALIYLLLSFQASFYGEVLTTLYFFLMQPIGLYVWLANRIQSRDSEKVVTYQIRKFGLMDWVKYLALTALIWLGMGLAYQSIHSARPFRDSVTDATNGVGQLLMTRLYREQWIFWIATNLFSIYLWWGANLHIQGMYWVYTLNSLVGWYKWSKNQ